MDEVKTFLKEYNNELQQSPTSDENIHPKIVSNYGLEREDVYNQVLDWALHYLENRKCPYQLAVAIAKSTAKQIDADTSEQLSEDNISQEKLLNSHALYTQTLKKLSSTCKSFSERIDDEICSKPSFPYTTSAFEIKNKRRTMEDRHVIHHDLNLLLDLKDAPAHSYYAVFDGHCGVDAASYASAHLHVNIAKHPDFLTDTPTAIAQSFKITDDNFLKKCSEENLKSGSTAVCALIREKNIYLSWVGDSQAVLVKGGKPVLITEPHKPERQDERKRIEDLGGSIVTYMGVLRVNGMLAITRALGDADHRPYISCEPDLATIDLDGTEDFLILACDGLFDGMSPEDVTASLYHNLAESALDEPLDAVAAKLVHKSKEQGSEDNITAIVLFLRDITAIKNYATELLSQASKQTNFIGMNGDEKHDSPCVKPTVLELNAASTKKLKNTANVLSSAGFTCPPVYSETGFDGHAFQNTDDNSIFVPQHSLPSYFAPEATALSELPTPPIDDVVASQQFGNLCSTKLYEGLNSISSEQSALVEDESNVFNSGVFDSMVNVQPPVNQISPESNVEASVTAGFTPDEAADIASCVVTNTIETAVKCLSSNEMFEPTSPVSQLNPYAKPFFPGEIQLQSEPEVITLSETIPDVAQSNLEETNPTESEVLQSSLSEKCSEDNVLDASVKDSLMEEKQDSSLNFTNLLEVNRDTGSKSPNVSTLTTQFSELSILSPQLSSGTGDEVDNLIEQNKMQNDQTREPNMQDKVNEIEQEFLNISHKSPQYTNEQELFATENTLIDSRVNLENTKNSVEIADEVNIHESVSNIVEKHTNVTTNIPQSTLFNEDNAIEQGIQIIQLNEMDSMTIHQIENHNELFGECHIPKEMLPSDSQVSKECIDNIVSDSENLIPEPENLIPELENLIPELENLIPEPKNLILEPENLILEPENLIPEPENLISEQENFIHDSYSNTLKNVINPDVPLNASMNLHESEKNSSDVNIKIESTEVAGKLLEIESVSPVKVSDTCTVLESVTFESLNLVGVNVESASTEAILPSDLADEGPVEAVDLQTIPVGVPEAEGVTEDIDSDSEKDGGWSYMKGNIIGSSGKAKPEESQPKVEKTASKVESTSKLKKDVSKAMPDNKSKVRSMTSTDKVKKPLLEKRVLEVKDKNKPTRTVSSTLPRDVSKSNLPKDANKPTLTKSSIEKTTKPASTFARIKKEVSSTLPGNKVSSLATAKPSRPTALRNPVPASKAGAPPTKERVLSATVKTTSTTTVGNVRPKSALASNGTKAPSRPPTLPKSQPPNQSKANVAPAARSTTLNRPAASTVPTRALNKPSTLLKTNAPESKVKPSVSTIRKVDSKKPDVKETKDIVNKQISARKNLATNTIIRSEITKSATTSNKRTMTLSNKPVPSKARSAPIKNEVDKKDVPKSTASRLVPKANNLLKSSLSAAKGSDKKVPTLQEKAKNPSELAAAVEQSSAVITPASEEEKFLLEVNDKEVIQSVKGDEKDEIGDHNLNCVENGVAESVKPLEETVPAINQVECSEQNI